MERNSAKFQKNLSRLCFKKDMTVPLSANLISKRLKLISRKLKFISKMLKHISQIAETHFPNAKTHFRGILLEWP